MSIEIQGSWNQQRYKNVTKFILSFTFSIFIVVNLNWAPFFISRYQNIKMHLFRLSLMLTGYPMKSEDILWNTTTFGQHYEPVILDASVFTSIKHCEAILLTRKTFYVSQTLYRMLYEDIFKTINFIKRHFTYFRKKPAKYDFQVLAEKLMAMRDFLKPYRYKGSLIEDLSPHFKKVRQPLVREIVLDEYSFLKERSSVLMRTRRFANYLHRLGVVTLDATNKIYWKKHELLATIRGLKWMVGIILVLKESKIIPLSQEYTMLGGLILLLLDP